MNDQMKFPAGTAFGSIGHPLRRKEDARLLTGKGRFTDDFSIDGETFAAMVRSETIDVPPDATVCWRHDRNPNKPVTGVWSGWTRATLQPGGSAHTDL